MYAQRAPAALGQHFKVAARLGGLHNSESIFLPRHGQVNRVVASDLQENSGVWSAFVSLPGRMQKARAKAETGRHAFPIARRMTRGLQGCFVCVIHLKVGEQR